MTVYGWDISNHDWGRRRVNLAEARHAGISFVTHKATEDTSYQDPFFDDYARQLRATPFPVEGSYHVLHSGNLAGQITYWWEYVNDVFPEWRTRPCWIWQVDAERWADGYPTPAEVDQFSDAIQAKAGCDRMQIPVYGPGWLYGDRLRVTDKPLWQSNYGANPVANFKSAYPGDHGNGWLPYSGHTPVIWQFGSQAIIGGQRTCDANAVRVASEAELVHVFRPARTPSDSPASQPPINLLEELDMWIFRPSGKKYKYPVLVTGATASVLRSHASVVAATAAGAKVVTVDPGDFARILKQAVK